METLDLTLLEENVRALHTAIQKYLEKKKLSLTETSGEKAKILSQAYKNDSQVRHYADTIFSLCRYLIYAPLRHCGYKENGQNLRHLDNIEFVAQFGDPEKDSFSGLMGAILKSNPNMAPQQIIYYYVQRINSEIIDYIRKFEGRSEKNHAMKSRVYHPLPLDAPFDDGENLNVDALKSCLIGTDNSDFLTAADPATLLLATRMLPDEDRKVVEEFITAAIDEHKTLEATTKWRMLALRNGQAKSLGHALLFLKFAYLSLHDDLLPDSIVEMKDAVAERKSSPQESAKAVYKFANMFGITQADLAKLCNISAAAISQMRSASVVSSEIINALGLQDRVNPDIVRNSRINREEQKAARNYRMGIPQELRNTMYDCFVDEYGNRPTIAALSRQLEVNQSSLGALLGNMGGFPNFSANKIKQVKENIITYLRDTLHKDEATIKVFEDAYSEFIAASKAFAKAHRTNYN